MLLLTIIALLVTVPNIVLSQTIKASVKKAESYLQANELTAAKNEIERALDKALARDYQQHNPKMLSRLYFVQGKTYQAIAVTEADSTMALAEAPLETAIAAFDKVKSLAIGDSIYVIFSRQQLEQLYIQYYNKGIDAYQSDQKDKALTYFNNLLLLRPNDTTAHLNIIYTAFDLRKKNRVEKSAKNLFQQEYNKADIYRILAILASEEKNYTIALGWVEQGIIQNLTDQTLLTQRVNLYIASEQYDAAVVALERLVIQQPEDPKLSFKLALLYTHKEDYQNAISNYNRVISLDSTYYDAYYSLGAIHFNQAVAINQILNALDMRGKGRYINIQKGKELERKAKEYYQKAIPYLEQASHIRPEAIENLQLLMKVYDILNDSKEYNRIRNMLDQQIH